MASIGKRFDLREVLAGALFVGAGGLFLVAARAYELGSLLRMGAGFYPTMLAVVLIGLGLAIAVRGLMRAGGEGLRFEWRGLASVLGGIAAFGLLIRGGGLYLAMPVAVGVAALGARPLRPLQSLAIAVLMTVGCDLIFRQGLKLPIPALGAWF